MKTVVDPQICAWLARNGYFYVMHRFDLDNLQFVREMTAQGLYASISVGVKQADHEAISRMRSEGLSPDFITIDIAHGHADSVHAMIRHIKENLPDAFVIAGNVGTPEAVINKNFHPLTHKQILIVFSKKSY